MSHMIGTVNFKLLAKSASTIQIRDFAHVIICAPSSNVLNTVHVFKRVVQLVQYALSNNLRWRVIWLHYYKELSCKEIAELLYIHPSTLCRVLDHYNSSGDVVPTPYKSGPKPLLDRTEEFAILEILMSRPDIYLNGLQKELFKSATKWANISTIFRTIRGLGCSRKLLRQVVL